LVVCDWLSVIGCLWLVVCDRLSVIGCLWLVFSVLWSVIGALWLFVRCSVIGEFLSLFCDWWVCDWSVVFILVVGTVSYYLVIFSLICSGFSGIFSGQLSGISISVLSISGLSFQAFNFMSINFRSFNFRPYISVGFHVIQSSSFGD